MSLLLGLCSSLPASHMLYCQYLEKGTTCVATTPLHTLLFPLPGNPFLPNQHLPVHSSPTSRNLPTSTNPSRPPAAELGSIPIVTNMSCGTCCCRNCCLSPPLYYKSFIGGDHIALISVLPEPRIKVQQCIFKTQHSVL